MKDIRIFNTFKTQVNKEAVKEWLDYLGADEFEWPEMVEDPALNIALAAKRCYNSFQPGLNPNVTRVRKDWVDYIDNILASGHGSVLEHSSYTFAIEGITRVFTAELNRHSVGTGISEASLRYIRFEEDGIDFWMPDSLSEDSGILSNGVMSSEELTKAKRETIAVFNSTIKTIQANYDHLVEVWRIDDMPFSVKKKVTSMLRRIIPLGVQVGGVWTMNLRACRHMISMRHSPHAEEEICKVFTMIVKYMIEDCPHVFGDFELSEEGYYVPRHWKV